MNFRAFFVCIFLSLFPFGLSASADDWTEYSTPHFQLYTNVSKAMAEDWVATLDTFTRLLPAPRQQNKQQEFKVIVLSDYSLFQNIKPNQTSPGFTHHTDDTTYLIVGRGIRPYAPHQHKEMVHTLFKSFYTGWCLSGYPYWFSHGTSHVFNHAAIDGNQAIISNNIREWVTHNPAPFPLSDLLFEFSRVTSPEYKLNSYAYVHYLLFGSVSGHPDYRDKLDRYLSSDVKTLETFELAMGQSLASIQEDFEKYKRVTELKAVAIKVADETNNIHQRQLTGDESNYLMARLLHQRNQYDYAQKYVKKISKASPQYSELQQQYEAHKTQEKVLKAAEKTLKKQPDNIELLIMSANAYWEQAKNTPTRPEANLLIHKAIERAQRASQLNPDDKDMHILLRSAYLRTRQTEKSFHHTKEQLRLEPENAGINFVVGRYYVLENNYEKARTHLNKACELDKKQCEFTAIELAKIEKREAGKTIGKP